MMVRSGMTLWGKAKLQQATTEESLFRVCSLADLRFLWTLACASSYRQVPSISDPFFDIDSRYYCSCQQSGKRADNNDKRCISDE